MDERFQKQVAFHLTGRRDDSGLEPLTTDHRPALFARYTDLTSLRYDFPLILNQDGAPERAIFSLSRLVDDAVSELSDDPHLDRIARHAYQIEAEIRPELAGSGTSDFASLWDLAARRVAERDESAQTSAAVLWKRFAAAGEIVDADAQLPFRTLRHLWSVVQEKKTRAFRKNAERLLYKLRDILEAEKQNSNAGRTPSRLKASVGAAFSGAFDFDRMSRIVGESKPAVQLSDERRERICGLIRVLEAQRFFPVGPDAPAAYEFAFTRCEDALKAYRQRQDEAVELLRTLAVSELEAKGEYREAVHDPIFEGFGSAGLSAAELGKLPDYLVTVNTSSLDARECARIIELITAALPVKILVQSDDILEPSAVMEGHIGLAVKSRQLINSAIGLTDVFVLQSSAAHLYNLRGPLLRGLLFSGPGLFSIYSGANAHTRQLPPYLVSASATESRAFPTLVYDPSAGTDWSTRFTLEGNPTADADWPCYEFDYEGEALQARKETLAFTFADFLAIDERFSERFAVVPNDQGDGRTVPVAESMEALTEDLPGSVPSVLLIDKEFRTARAIVDARALRGTRRCLSMWHSLQELGGINNSYVERFASQRSLPLSEAPQAAQPQATSEEAVETAAETGTPVDSDEPYIETARCTTCNECTQINSKMFAYNPDKQAYIADRSAGTFRQLVEAAEGCQVSIIHPGKPRDPNEPGLEELIQRASLFS